MVFLFPLTAVLYVIVLIAAAVGIAMFVVDFIPFFICILIVLTCFILELGIGKLSFELYYKSLSKCDKDYDDFLHFQDRIVERSSSKGKYFRLTKMIIANEIIGILAHERLDDAENRIRQLGQMIGQNEMQLRMQYVSLLFSLSLKKKDFKSADYFINELREVFSQTGIEGQNPKLGERMKLSIEHDAAELEISRHIHEKDSASLRTAVENALLTTEKMTECYSYTKIYPNLYHLNLKMNKASYFAVLGRNSEADEIFEEIKRSGVAYPMIKKIDEYMKTRDVSILF